MATTRLIQNSNLPFTLKVASGAILNYKFVNKFGYNAATGTAQEDIWEGGGVYTGQPGTAETADVFSSDGADDAAGTGLRTLRIEGLDASGAEQTEDVTLDGTAIVTTTGVWNRIYRAYGLTAGTNETNVGTITIRHTTTTANVFAQIQPDAGQSLIAAYTIPAGFKGLLVEWHVDLARNAGTAATGEVVLLTRASGGVWRVREKRNASFSYAAVVPMYEILDAGTDIKVRALSTTAESAVAATFDILLIPEG